MAKKCRAPKVYPVQFRAFVSRADGDGEKYVYNSGTTDYVVAQNKKEAYRLAREYGKDWFWEWIGDEDEKAKGRFEAHLDDGMSLSEFVDHYRSSAECIIGDLPRFDPLTSERRRHEYPSRDRGGHPDPKRRIL